MKSKYKNIETQLIRSGELEPRVLGAVSMPVFQSSTFEYGGEEGYDSIRYIRLNNTPNHTELNKKIAELESAEAAMVTSSGMAGSYSLVLKANERSSGAYFYKLFASDIQSETRKMLLVK